MNRGASSPRPRLGHPHPYRLGAVLHRQLGEPLLAPGLRRPHTASRQKPSRSRRVQPFSQAAPSVAGTTRPLSRIAGRIRPRRAPPAGLMAAQARQDAEYQDRRSGAAGRPPRGPGRRAAAGQSSRAGLEAGVGGGSGERNRVDGRGPSGPVVHALGHLATNSLRRCTRTRCA